MSTSASVVRILTLPVLIAAVAVYPLWEVLDSTAVAFLELERLQQTSAMALIFAVIFAAVSVSSIYSAAAGSANSHNRFVACCLNNEDDSKKKEPTDYYPLAEIAAAESDKDKFKVLFDHMLESEIVEYLETHNELLPEAADWISEMVSYSVPGGKLNRGTTVIDVYRTLIMGKKNRTLTDYEVAKAAVAGWCIEFLQAFFLVADDLMDESQTRRGQPCWYKLPKVGTIAVNDSFLLESFVFQILRTHFGHEPYYPDLVELLLDVTQKTEIGQLYDLTSQTPDGKIDLERFTIDRYRRIVKYKTAFYSFYLPVAMGLLMSGMRNATAYQTARDVCVEMGEYFQIQDDYLDCFGDPAVIGKVGTDIQDNKCSWLVVQALAKCNPAQRAILEKNYGTADAKKVQRVKDLYRELELPEQFQEYEEESYQRIQKQLDAITNIMPRDVFELLLKKIYKRSK